MNLAPDMHVRSEQHGGTERQSAADDGASILALAAHRFGLPHCHGLDRLRRSRDFIPELSLTLWQGSASRDAVLQAHVLLARLPLCVGPQRLTALIAAPVIVRSGPDGAPPGAGAFVLAQAMRRASELGFSLLALPLSPSYYRHAGFVPPLADSPERGPFAAGIPFVLKGLGLEHEALAQSLAPHLIVYAHAERLL